MCVCPCEIFLRQAAVSLHSDTSLINFHIRLTVHLSQLEMCLKRKALTGFVPICSLSEGCL